MKVSEQSVVASKKPKWKSDSSISESHN